MKIDQAVSLFASIGACLSAIAAFLTVREISKQRQTTYRPELVPSRTPFMASKCQLTTSVLPDRWTQIFCDDIEKIAPAASAAVAICNVGLGSAKHVELTWSFDIELLISRVNALAQKTLFAAYFELEDGHLSFKSDNDGNSVSMWCNQQTESFDYVLPATVEEIRTFAPIPHAFCQLISALVFFSGQKKNFSFLEDMPTIDLTITFLDIGDVSHKAQFKLTPHISSISGKGESFEGYLESSRCV